MFAQVAQKVATAVLHLTLMIFIQPHITAIFVEKNCCQELSKIAQSGHTDNIPLRAITTKASRQDAV